MGNEKWKYIFLFSVVIIFTGLLVWNIILREQLHREQKITQEYLHRSAEVIQNNSGVIEDLKNSEKANREQLDKLMRSFGKTQTKIDSIRLYYDTVKSNFSDTAIYSFWDGILSK